jgi:hypothetical protein
MSSASCRTDAPDARLRPSRSRSPRFTSTCPICACASITCLPTSITSADASCPLSITTSFVRRNRAAAPIIRQKEAVPRRRPTRTMYDLRPNDAMPSHLWSLARSRSSGSIRAKLRWVARDRPRGGTLASRPARASEVRELKTHRRGRRRTTTVRRGAAVGRRKSNASNSTTMRAATPIATHIQTSI